MPNVVAAPTTITSTVHLTTRTHTGTAALRGATVYRVYCGTEGGSVT